MKSSILGYNDDSIPRGRLIALGEESLYQKPIDIEPEERERDEEYFDKFHDVTFNGNYIVRSEWNYAGGEDTDWSDILNFYKLSNDGLDFVNCKRLDHSSKNFFRYRLSTSFRFAILAIKHADERTISLAYTAIDAVLDANDINETSLEYFGMIEINEKHNPLAP